MMYFRWSLVAALFVAWFMVESSSIPSDVGGGLCATHVIIHGYPCQEFHVTTEDGYILSLQRIHEGRSNRSGAAGTISKQPVLLQHGLFGDGTSWLLNRPENSLPLILADKGFDVWIMNTRGTQYSRRHISLNSHQRKYWDWSWDELASYDFSAAVNLVYSNSGQQKINYVGHSLGTLIGLTALSEGNQISKLRSGSLLSPIAYLSHMKNGLVNLAARSLLAEAYMFLGIAEFDPSGDSVKEFLRMICNRLGGNCDDMFSGFTGIHRSLNESNLLNAGPQPTSTKNMMHLAQTVRSGRLSKYDYVSTVANLFHYGQISPPVYNLGNIPHDFPLFLSYGGKDDLSDTLDVTHLLHILKDHDPDKIITQEVQDYGHLDFIFAPTAKDIVFSQILKFIEKPF